LRPVGNHQLPLDEKYVFELTRSDNESIRDVAFEMMKHLSSDKIHNYAVSLLLEKKEIANAMSLLCSCYKPNDEKLLAEAIKSLTVSYDEGSWHSAFMDIQDLLDKRSCKIDPGLFLNIYRQTLCSSCRFYLVESMFKRKILPLEILEECMYDSYEETRKFAARKLGRRK